MKNGEYNLENSRDVSLKPARRIKIWFRNSTQYVPPPPHWKLCTNKYMYTHVGRCIIHNKNSNVYWWMDNNHVLYIKEYYLKLNRKETLTCAHLWRLCLVPGCLLLSSSWPQVKQIFSATPNPDGCCLPTNKAMEPAKHDLNPLNPWTYLHLSSLKLLI
jgi:hypothetical protein